MTASAASLAPAEVDYVACITYPTPDAAIAAAMAALHLGAARAEPKEMTRAEPKVRTMFNHSKLHYYAAEHLAAVLREIASRFGRVDVYSVAPEDAGFRVKLEVLSPDIVKSDWLERMATSEFVEFIVPYEDFETDTPHLLLWSAKYCTDRTKVSLLYAATAPVALAAI